ncbi:TPA: hypothetical protein N0F65_010429 [Lagenidium giganteum]|uniref:Uncharacterized protein n=1 Tax=Lagenidium giganteum TaxID=4803 RepID=A0AAV2YTR3_9STRA|nr:TPA: hypothetical protein N0F65_010429 [Lagenidium giganteum]
MRRPRTTLATLLAVALVSAVSAAASDPIGAQHADLRVVQLFPDQPRLGERVPCGETQVYRLHQLQRAKLYDLKVSFPANIPTDFHLEVHQVLLTAGTRDDANVAQPRRQLFNTAKLRLVPAVLAADAFRLQLDDAATTMVSVDVFVRPEVEGVSHVLDLASRQCVYDVVVEELLFGAFPRETLVLIAWVLLLLVLSQRVIYPYVLDKVLLRRPEDQFKQASGKQS